MGDFDRPRRARRLVVVGAVVAALIVAAGAGWWLLRPNPSSTTTSTGASVSPAWPATAAVSRVVSAPADAGQGWVVPAAGAAGPRRVTDLGVPYGYTHDAGGAALAAVNAVVAARYLASTFPDPWAALGFLADPRYADRGGNPTVEAFFTGPAPVVVIDPPDGPATTGATPAVTAPPTGPGDVSGGARVLGVRVASDPSTPDTVRVVVLWQRFSLQGEQDAAGRPGYTVVIEPVGLQLAWVDEDWKVSGVGVPPDGPATVVGTVPADFPVPAEDWHR
jgi:hypothetical protein